MSPSCLTVLATTFAISKFNMEDGDDGEETNRAGDSPLRELNRSFKRRYVILISL